MPNLNQTEEELWNESKKIVQQEYKKKNPKYWGTVQRIFQAKKEKHLGKGRKKKEKKKMKKSDLYSALVKQANTYMKKEDIKSFSRLIPVMRRLNKEAALPLPTPETIANLTPAQLGTYYEQLQSRYFALDEQFDNLETHLQEATSSNPGEAADRLRNIEGQIAEVEQVMEAIQTAYQTLTGERYIEPESSVQQATETAKPEKNYKEPPVRKRQEKVKQPEATEEEMADATAIRELSNPKEEVRNLKEEILRRIFTSARRGIGQTTSGSRRVLGRNIIEYLQGKLIGGEASDDFTAGLGDLTFTDTAGNRIEPADMNLRILQSIDRIERLIGLHADNIKEQADSFWRTADLMSDQPPEEVLSFAAQVDQVLAAMLRKSGQRITSVVHSFDKNILGVSGRMGIERTGPQSMRRRPYVDDPNIPHESLPAAYRTEISGPAKGKKGRHIAPIPMEGRAPTEEEINEAGREKPQRFSPSEMGGRRSIPMGQKVVRRRKEPGEKSPSKKERPNLDLPDWGPDVVRRTRLPKRRK